MTMRLTAPSPSRSAVDGFLHAVLAGEGVPANLYADDAVLDGTVPGWRFRVVGPAAITRKYARWFADPGRFEELARYPVDGGEVVTYLLAWEEDGAPFAAHHCHVITLDDDGRIARDVAWCGGRWGARLLAEMGATVDA